MIKIEKKMPVVIFRKQAVNGEWKEFLTAVNKLKVGESFQFRKIASNHRLALSIAHIWLERNFICAKQKDGTFRLGRKA